MIDPISHNAEIDKKRKEKLLKKASRSAKIVTTWKQNMEIMERHKHLGGEMHRIGPTVIQKYTQKVERYTKLAKRIKSQFSSANDLF